MSLYFSDVFGVSPEDLESHGAFNISLVSDLPLFIDPFLLFNSDKPHYQQLHEQMIQYLRFLHARSAEGALSPDLIDAWYRFPEVKQNWLGFSETGNRGRGLGRRFANALNVSLAQVFPDFGREQITRGSHIEKLCLVGPGVGVDMISDFTANLIKGYLLEYTQDFAERHIAPDLRRTVAASRVAFSYSLERWMPAPYDLPVFEGDYVILTPRDILTKDDTWISHGDMVNRFLEVPDAIGNEQLRAEINNYFRSVISETRKPKRKDYERAVEATLRRFPTLVDYYIKMKEDAGDQAVADSNIEVSQSHRLYVEQSRHLLWLLSQHTPFLAVPRTTREETRQRIEFFKDVIEKKGGHRLFYLDGRPIRREADVQLMFRLVWYATLSDVSREVNDGRGPADYKVSRGSADKTIVEMKLGSNTQLKRNLRRQVATYKRASDARTGFTMIVYFYEAEQSKVLRILKELDLLGSPNIFLIDARMDNKPSGSRA